MLHITLAPRHFAQPENTDFELSNVLQGRRCVYLSTYTVKRKPLSVKSLMQAVQTSAPNTELFPKLPLSSSRITNSPNFCLGVSMCFSFAVMRLSIRSKRHGVRLSTPSAAIQRRRGTRSSHTARSGVRRSHTAQSRANTSPTHPDKNEVKLLTDASLIHLGHRVI